MDLPIDRSCEREKVLFEELFISDQAKALMYAFFAERAASKVVLLDMKELFKIRIRALSRNRNIQCLYLQSNLD